MSAALGAVRSGSPDRHAGERLPLLREIGDLKRITSAGRRGSIATRLFRSAWAELVSGREPTVVALGITARALAATRLGDLDSEALTDLGLSSDEAASVVRAGLDDVSDAVSPALRLGLREALIGAPVASVAVPAFVTALEGQPRAGVTCPGRPRIVLLPAESHAEHCLVVAVYGVLLSPRDDADVGTVFLAALAHHLHNAVMPDSGFTGEMLLGPQLAPLMRRASARALAELPPGLRANVEAACRILPDAETPEGRAFHAADVLDRVLEIEQHLATRRLTMDVVLRDMALVHEGPVKPFHDRVLIEMGLA